MGTVTVSTTDVVSENRGARVDSSSWPRHLICSTSTQLYSRSAVAYAITRLTTMGTDPRASTESHTISYPSYDQQAEHFHDLHNLLPDWHDALDFANISQSTLSANSSSFARPAAEPFSWAHESFESSTHLGLSPTCCYFPISNVFSGDNLWRSDFDGPWTALRSPAHPVSAGAAGAAGATGATGAAAVAASTYAVGQWAVNGRAATLRDDTMGMRTDCDNLADPSWDAASTASTSQPSYYSSAMYTPFSSSTVPEDIFISPTPPSDRPYLWNDNLDHLSDWEPVPRTSRNAEPPPTSESTLPRYQCPIRSCTSRFIRQADLVRHLRIHTTQEQGQGYRCAFHECPKAGKIWTRLDTFKKHVQQRHKGADVNELVQKSSRVRHGADTNFPFSVTTPASMSQKRLSKGQPRAREGS